MTTIASVSGACRRHPAPGTDTTPAVGVTTGTTPVMAAHDGTRTGTLAAGPRGTASTDRGTNVRGGA